MDQLIILLIQGLIKLFGGDPKPPPRGAPPMPPRQPAQPRPVSQQPQRQPQRPPQRQPQRPQPAGRPAARTAPAAPAMRQAVSTPPPAAPPSPRPAAAAPPRPSAAVDAAALRRWLRPQTLRTQFILTEILQPPPALREH